MKFLHVLLCVFFVASCSTAPEPGSKAHIDGLRQHEDDHHHHGDELLVINPPADYEKSLSAMGLSVIDITNMAALKMRLYHLKIENGDHPFVARQTHRKRHPGVTVDVHHHFEQHATRKKKRKIDKSYTSRRAVNWGAPHNKCGAGIRIGIIDGAVDANHPTFKGRTLVLKSFQLKGQKVGAINHGTAVANVIVGNKKWGGLLPGAKLYAASVSTNAKKEVPVLARKACCTP